MPVILACEDNDSMFPWEKEKPRFYSEEGK